MTDAPTYTRASVFLLLGPSKHATLVKLIQVGDPSEGPPKAFTVGNKGNPRCSEPSQGTSSARSTRHAPSRQPISGSSTPSAGSPTTPCSRLADSLMHGAPYFGLLKQYYRAYPHAGYGGSFHQWAQSEDSSPYNSWGNGSAMRVSPVGFACATLDDVLSQAQRSAEVTHDHPEGLKGAQAVASAVFLARTGQGKEQIKNYVEGAFDYDLDTPLDEIRPTYEFQVSCQKSVPQAIRAFLESANFEDAVRMATPQ